MLSTTNTTTTTTTTAAALSVAYGVNIGHGHVKAVQIQTGRETAVCFPAQLAPAPPLFEGGAIDRPRTLVGAEAFYVGRHAGRRGRAMPTQQRLGDPTFLPALATAALAELEAQTPGYCVTGLPATWMQPQKMQVLAQHLRGAAGDLFSKIRVIPEPLGPIHAATLADDGVIAGDPALVDGTVLVVDWGFYTLDWVLVERLVPDARTAGTANVGMGVALEQLRGHLAAAFDRPFTLHQAEEAARTGYLGAAGQAHQLPAAWDLPIAQLAQEGVERLIEAVGAAAHVDAVLLAGGTVADERVGEALIHRFPHAVFSEAPQLAVARGFARYAMRCARGLV
jgi:plasmid segregation protein ParM